MALKLCQEIRNTSRGVHKNVEVQSSKIGLTVNETMKKYMVISKLEGRRALHDLEMKAFQTSDIF